MDSIEFLSGTQPKSECSICIVNPVNVIMTCSHLLCSSCAFRIQSEGQPCPFCRMVMTSDNVFYLKESGRSTDVEYSKLTRLTTMLQSVYMKTVVFIQWLELAQYVERELKKRNIPVRIFNRSDRYMAKTLQWFDRKVNNRTLIVPLFLSNCIFQIPSVQRVVFYHPVFAANAYSAQRLERRCFECILPAEKLEVHRLVTHDTIECT